MHLGPYRDVLALRDARRVMLLGLLTRIPLWAGNVVLTLHVVSHLHRSYAAAGLLTGLATVALAASGPWRGRRLDRIGLRRTMLPSLVALVLCWSFAPFLGYLPLLVLAVVAGIFEFPSFSIVRQTLLHAVPEPQRRTALSLDSVAVEISFMIGPVLGVLLATGIGTPWALFACEFASVLGGLLTFVVNPPLRAAGADAAPTRAPLRSWLRLDVVAVLAACAATTLVLAGTDVAIVAALRHLGHQSSIGWVLAVWGLGSAAGGVVYGALRRPIPVFGLLALLGAATVPVAFGQNPVTLAALLLLAGFFCAPTVVATVDTLSRHIPERVRGEALGWHGGAMIAGSALGAPVAGLAIDRVGWPGGFALPGLIGLAVAVIGLLATARRRAPAPADPGRRDDVIDLSEDVSGDVGIGTRG